MPRKRHVAAPKVDDRGPRVRGVGRRILRCEETLHKRRQEPPARRVLVDGGPVARVLAADASELALVDDLVPKAPARRVARSRTPEPAPRVLEVPPAELRLVRHAAGRCRRGGGWRRRRDGGARPRGRGRGGDALAPGVELDEAAVRLLVRWESAAAAHRLRALGVRRIEKDGAASEQARAVEGFRRVYNRHGAEANRLVRTVGVAAVTAGREHERSRRQQVVEGVHREPRAVGQARAHPTVHAMPRRVRQLETGPPGPVPRAYQRLCKPEDRLRAHAVGEPAVAGTPGVDRVLREPERDPPVLKQCLGPIRRLDLGQLFRARDEDDGRAEVGNHARGEGFDVPRLHVDGREGSDGRSRGGHELEARADGRRQSVPLDLIADVAIAQVVARDGRHEVAQRERPESLDVVATRGRSLGHTRQQGRPVVRAESLLL